jgi:hypothetical protein
MLEENNFNIAEKPSGSQRINGFGEVQIKEIFSYKNIVQIFTDFQ